MEHISYIRPGAEWPSQRRILPNLWYLAEIIIFRIGLYQYRYVLRNNEKNQDKDSHTGSISTHLIGEKIDLWAAFPSQVVYCCFMQKLPQ